MIEIIQNNAKGENKSESKRPNNIRQVGNPEGKTCIYLEDYVCTYLHQKPQEGEASVGILLGHCQSQKEEVSLYISGAVGIHSEEENKEQIFLKEETWEQIYQTMKKYFHDLEIVGWYELMVQNGTSMTPAMEQIRKKYFDGAGKTLYLADPSQGEEALFVWEHGTTVQKGGYYVYYEKNSQMQEYMISARLPKRRVEQEWADSMRERNQRGEMAQSYRTLLLEKQQQKAKNRWHGFAYALAGAFVVAAAVYGGTMVDGIEQIKKVERTLSVMAKQGVTLASDEAEAKEEPVESASAANTQREEEQTLPTDEQTVIVEQVEGGVKAEEDKTEENKQEEKDEENAAAGQEETTETQGEEQDGKEGQPQETESADKEEKENGSSQTASAQEHCYIVKKGDSLDRICMKLYETMEVKGEICALNGITDEDHISIGQKLLLP